MLLVPHIIKTDPAITYHLSKPSLLLDMAGNNRRCLRLREQERRNGRRDLIACQREFKEYSRFSERHLHPAVLGNFDSCKKGAVQSPRATVIFAIGLRALATFASIYSGGLVAVCILRSDVQQRLSISYVHMAYIPNFKVLHPKVSSGGFEKAFVGLEEQERVAA